MKNKKIIILDDHPVVRRGLSHAVEHELGYTVTHQLDKAEEALKLLDKTDIDLFLVDVSLPGMNGIELIKKIVFQNPDQKILVISRHNESVYAERALKAGSKGYITKFEPLEEILNAIEKVLNGGIYVSNAMKDKLFKNSMNIESSEHSTLSALSDRELEIYELVGRGKSTSEIANQLHLAAKTVDTYRSRIKEKMGFDNSNEMIYHAVKWIENDKLS